MSSVRHVPAGFVLRAVGLLVLGASVGQAQSDRATDRIRGFNDAVLRLHGEMEHATSMTAAELHRQGVAAISQRAAEMSSLIDEDPAQALSMAFSADLVAELAEKFPEAAGLLETQGTWRGNAEYWVEDTAAGSSRSRIFLRLDGQKVEIHFAGHVPEGLKSGDVLEVAGARLGSRLAASSGSLLPAGPLATVTANATGAACTTAGAQNTAVLVGVPPGTALPAGVTQASLYDTFFGTASTSLDGYWREASSGKTWATGNVFGPYALTGTYSCSNLDPLASDTFAAATAAGVNLTNYTRIFLIYPNLGCNSVEGVATVGCQTLPSPSGSFTASQSNLIADVFTNHNNGVAYAAHEGGHNLGLMHARARGFAPNVVGPLGATGSLIEYGDMFSTMGVVGLLGHYAAPQKAELLNWLASGSDYQVVQTSGTWTLQPAETSAGLRSLKVQRGTGNNAWLWIEYRQPIGNYDSTLNSQVFAGALIHYEDSQTGNWSDLLDFTPSTVSWLDSALVPGQTWVDPYTNVSITVQSANASGVTVSVNYGGSSSCTHANPKVTISPANPSVSAGASVSYAVSVTNNDTSGCTASGFSLTSAQPSGWLGALSATTLTVSPGQTSNTTLTETLPANFSPGTYPISSSASSGSYAATASANATVVAASTLTDILSAPGSSYSASSHQTITFTATVSNGNSAAVGASVNFTLIKANGSKMTGTATTGSNGQASWSYRLTQKDPTGVYSASSSASYLSQTATSSTVTLTVH